MDVNPYVRELCEELDLRGVAYETDHSENEVDHMELVRFESRGHLVEIMYAFCWNEDSEKIGVSLGWPMYLELMVDGESSIADIDDVLGWLP